MTGWENVLVRRRRAVVTAVATLAIAAAGLTGWQVWQGSAQTPDPVAPTTLSVPVGPEPDGSAVELDVDLYRPASPTSSEGAATPAVLLAHGFGGSKDDLAVQARRLADEGHVVLAWTARGFGGSGGRVHLNDPDFEVADASALVDVLAETDGVRLDAEGDPVVAAVGASYGGAVSLMLAGADPRVDSVVAQITWHDLAEAFFPQQAVGVEAPGPFKQLWASSFFASIAGAPAGDEMTGDEATGGPDLCGRFDPDACTLFRDAAETGEPSEELLALLARNSPAPTLSQVDVPVYLVQGMTDSLFGVEHAQDAAAALREQGTPVAVRWINGGHDAPSDSVPLAGAGGAGGATEGEGAQGSGGAGAGGGAAPAGGGGGSAQTALAEEQEQVEQDVLDWLDGTLPAQAEPTETSLPLPAFTYALPHQRGQESYRVLTSDPAAGSVTTLPLNPADGSVLVNPPGGVPAALTSVPGLGALAGQIAGYPLAALPGQHVAFDTEEVSEGLTVVGAPELDLSITSSGTASTLFVSWWQVGESGPLLARPLVAPVRVPVAEPGEPVAVTVQAPPAAYDLPAGSSWRVLVTATDSAYRVPTQTRVDTLTVTDATLTLPVAEGTRVGSGLGVPDTEVLGVGGALLGVLALAGVLTWRRRRRGDGRSGSELEPGDRRDLGDVPLSVSGLVKAYPDGHRAVDGVTWQARRGQVVGLLGPNGAGKTTTLRMVMGLIRPDAGEVHVLGQPVGPGSPVLGRVGALVEGPGFLPHLSGRDNLRAYWAATGRPEREAHLPEVLDVAALGSALERPVRTYSHGMQQRLGIAQAMLGLPEVLVLDEPTNGLDPPQIAGLRPILRRYAAAGRTVVVSSHLLAEVEMTCSHVVVMHAGRVVVAGSVQEIGVEEGRSLEEVFLETIAGVVRDDVAVGSRRGAGGGATRMGGHSPDGSTDPGADADERTEQLRQVRPR